MSQSPEMGANRPSFPQMMASAVSNLGNPFTLLFLFTFYSCFHFLPLNRAINIVLVILFLALVPTGLFIVYNVKRGVYTNYDVSNQKQRPSLYIFSLSVIFLILAGLIYNHEPLFIIGGSGAAFLLLLISFFVNMRVKCSLHTAFSVFVAICFLPLSVYWSLGLFCFSLLMGWSRLVLHRHTLTEVLTGALLGTSTGFLFYYLIEPYSSI